MQRYDVSGDHVGDFIPEKTVPSTIIEHCSKRLSGRRTCVDRILSLDRVIKSVYVGIGEREIFLGENTGSERLEVASVKVVILHNMDDWITRSPWPGVTVRRNRDRFETYVTCVVAEV